MQISGEIHFNLREFNTLDIQVYGGEYEHDCKDCGYTKISEYGIQIGNLSFELSPELAIDLCKKLKEHLKLNGHEI